ncbi:type I restriction-modification enzyme R subunit C-terminal domain-containing protein [Methylicorpusculum sp.]|uniref:type I restriction-modification enzyme R subunit C-terminal domain-containing protein n=1 Tax=Methylicorpusculum sp. TaxID=2713644 RepID=UPI0027253EF0|nr:type I restriction-modification enzyme R subunit C-terminal domain-containing protein [Methylicorpusculum sp.]MDO8845731.1 type I restriction-modification enzyme R subunit C-terminal domain-containing protein [Methylicorpusculum sp.]
MQKKLRELESLWGVAPDTLHQHLHQLGPQQASEFVQRHKGLLKQLDEVKLLLGSEYYPVLADHQDELQERVQNYGNYAKPADYLDSFHDFIKHQLNQSAALSVVVNKPKDLTREQLKEIKLLLDQYGYTEAKLQSAWRNQTNQDIAASIIGYIRQAAIGEALIPFEQRVSQAMQKIYALHNWTAVQRRWLDRLAKQLSHEVVIDQTFVNRVFANDGGAKTLNNLLNQQLNNVLDTLADSLWSAA